MAVQTHDRRIQTPTVDRRAGDWPGSLVILASLGIGAASALSLSLGVYAGATEAVITGSLLLGFGLGWAALAVISARKTGSPQRWARVPAIAMTTTGLALITFAPGNEVLTLLTWVWPPLMLILGAWMYLQARRTMPGRSRWLLIPVYGVLAFSAIGALAQDAIGPDADESSPPGETYTVGDHRLHLDCQGTGAPTVILFNGLGEFSSSWSRITDQVSATTRICAYDRAGQGWSDEVDTAQDGIAAAADLHALLAAAELQGPYVLVGHSIGGPYALTYAAQYPADVAGMVLLDSSSPEQFTEVPAYPMQYQLMKRGLSLLPTLARIGLGSMITPDSQIPNPDGELVTAMNSTVEARRNGRDELSMLPVLFEQSRALATLGDRPLFVLTASENLDTDGWAHAQDQLATLSTDTIHRTVDSSHVGLVEAEGGADASAAAVTDVVDAIASHSALATR